jgi:hypothetical protein
MQVATRILVCAVVLVVLIGGGQWAAAETPQQDGLAAYEWHGAGQLTRRDARQRLRFLQQHGFKTVYLDLGDYLDAADQPESRKQRNRIRKLRRDLRRFVADASRLGLAVHAVGGGPTWTDEPLRYLGSKLVELVADYNADVAARERLGGVQLDIEPYALPRFFNNEEAALVAYLETLESIVETYRRMARHLELGFAVPFWFDGRRGSPGPVPFQAATKPAIHHVIDLVKDLRGAYLVVMSYRNFAKGADGSIVHARDEFRYARSIGAKCGLVVGQQFGDLQPPKVTFHGHDRHDFESAAEQIVRAFRRFRQFRGLSVDDVDGYTTLWQRDAVVQLHGGTSTAAGRTGAQPRTLGIMLN